MATTTPALVNKHAPGRGPKNATPGSFKPGMGLAKLTLDKGVRTTAVGSLYGLDYTVRGAGFTATIYFDRYSRRLKVLDYDATDYRALCDRLAYLAHANKFDKTFLKATGRDWRTFLQHGFVLEGILKYYFDGADAFVMSRFWSAERAVSHDVVEEMGIVEKLTRSTAAYAVPKLGPGYRLLLATEEHVEGMIDLYRLVFRTYPSPLTLPGYIEQTMARDVVYRVIVNRAGQVVSSASAEINSKYANAEVTDCATLETERGKGLMYSLVAQLEEDLKRRGIRTGYTLARAISFGMNQVFHRLGYEYTGRLVNSCDIAGRLEDMNIWVKRLAAPPRRKKTARS